MALKKKSNPLFAININKKVTGCGGFFYGLGFLGALAYYVVSATSIWGVITGFFMALLWPAFLVHGLLAFIGA
jgi:hypothetical protein